MPVKIQQIATGFLSDKYTNQILRMGGLLQKVCAKFFQLINCTKSMVKFFRETLLSLTSTNYILTEKCSH